MNTLFKKTILKHILLTSLISLNSPKLIWGWVFKLTCLYSMHALFQPSTLLKKKIQHYSTRYDPKDLTKLQPKETAVFQTILTQIRAIKYNPRMQFFVFKQKAIIGYKSFDKVQS